MPEGAVKFFLNDKGYGFLEVDGLDDVFLHARDLRSAGIKQEPAKGDRFSFEIGHGPKGLKAINVKRVVGGAGA